MDTSSNSFTGSLISKEISGSADSIRNRLYNVQFNNTIELNSTVYFCRAKHNEFNYSANPTYLSGSEIRVKNQGTDAPISYITSIGLYSADNQLLAVGKFSEPIRKDSNIELTFRARLDYQDAMHKFKFEPDDLFVNRLKTYPEYNVFIYQGEMFVNSESRITGSGGMIVTGKQKGHRAQT